ncbi:hypothetical protein Ancab_029600, partial [Ancistrocladus abbreviatus]
EHCNFNWDELAQFVAAVPVVVVILRKSKHFICRADSVAATFIMNLTDSPEICKCTDAAK